MCNKSHPVWLRLIPPTRLAGPRHHQRSPSRTTGAQPGLRLLRPAEREIQKASSPQCSSMPPALCKQCAKVFGYFADQLKPTVSTPIAVTVLAISVAVHLDDCRFLAVVATSPRIVHPALQNVAY